MNTPTAMRSNPPERVLIFMNRGVYTPTILLQTRGTRDDRYRIADGLLV